MSSVNIENLLYDEIETEFDKLSQLEPGTEQHKLAADTLTKLMDRAIELDKVEIECKDKEATRESEQLLKEQQMKDEKKDRLIKNIIGAAGVVLPLIVTIWGTKVSMRFEKEDSFTTIMGRGFIQKLLPKK